jgi:hypothetical protein
LGKRDSLSHWVLLLLLLLGIGLIKCQKKNCVHKEDYSLSLLVIGLSDVDVDNGN